MRGRQSNAIMAALCLVVATAACNPSTTPEGEQQVAEAVEQWKVSLPGGFDLAEASTIDSTTILHGGTGADRQLVAVDTKTGKDLWEKPLDGYADQVWVSKDTAVFVSENQNSSKPVLEVIDLENGKKRFDYEINVKLGSTQAYSVAVTNDTVVISESDSGSRDVFKNQVTALSLTDSTEKWSNELEFNVGQIQVKAPITSPQINQIANRSSDNYSLRQAVETPVVYIGGYLNATKTFEVNAVDVDSGDTRWKMPKDTPFGADSLITWNSKNHTVHWPDPIKTCDQVVYSVNVKDGAVKTIETRIATVTEDGKWTCGVAAKRPLISEDVVFGQSDKNYPQVTEVDSEEVAWTANETGDPIFYADGVAIYAPKSTERDRPLKAVKVSTGETLWSSSESRFGLKSYDSPSLAVFKGELLAFGAFGSEDQIQTRCFELRSGKAKWMYDNAVPEALSDNAFVFTTVGEPTNGPMKVSATSPSGKSKS